MDHHAEPLFEIFKMLQAHGFSHQSPELVSPLVVLGLVFPLVVLTFDQAGLPAALVTAGAFGQVDQFSGVVCAQGKPELTQALVTAIGSPEAEHLLP